MDVRKDFSFASPGEREPYSFSFWDQVAAGEELVSAEFEIEEAKRDPGVAADGSLASRLDGAASVSTDPDFPDDTRDLVASQWVQNLLPGIRYRLICTATTSTGAERKMSSEVYCEPFDRELQAG